MKKIIGLLLLAVFMVIGLHGFPPSCVMSHAQTAPAAPAAVPAPDGLGFNFAVGQDNAYLCQGGKCYMAIGGGVDILGYQKVVGTKGSVLDLKLHGMMLAKVTNNESGTLAGAAVTMDVVKLISGTGISILIPELTCLIGPAIAYDINKGGLAYGGMINFNYKF